MTTKIIGSEKVKRGMAQMQKRRRHHGCRERGAGKDRRGCWCSSGHGFGARALGYPRSRQGARMADPTIVEEVMNAVSIPVMAKARIGHITEARILEAMGVDYIDESEVLTPADEEFHLLKSDYTVPFVCGCRDLGEAYCAASAKALRCCARRGEPGTGNIVEAVRHMRKVNSQIRQLITKSDDELMTFAKEIGAPYELVKEIKLLGKLPVVNCCWWRRDTG